MEGQHYADLITSARRGVLARRPARLVIALTLLVLISLGTTLAPWLAPDDPHHAEAEIALQDPSSHHPLGTDQIGRDVLSRLLYGGRRTLGAALLTVGFTLVPGLIIGLLAGYFRGWIDWALMIGMDALLAFPSLLLALALVALFGRGMVQIALAVGIAGIPAYARVTRAAVLEARTRLYIEAARAVGARPAGILWRHVVPTILPTLASFAGVMLSWAILSSAALTFLGYGGDIAAPDWGTMLADGRQAFRTAPWLALAPGVALSLTVFAINLLAGSVGQARR